MSVTTRTDNPYVHQIDESSVASFRAACATAATEAERDAAQKDEEAGEMRRQAAEWIDKGVDSAAEPLLREAAALEAVADNRRQAAAAYKSV